MQWVIDAFKSLTHNTVMEKSFITYIIDLLEDPFYQNHPGRFLIVVTAIKYKNDGSFDATYRGNAAYQFADDFLLDLEMEIEGMGNQEFDRRWYRGSLYPYEFQFSQWAAQFNSTSDSDSGVSAIGRWVQLIITISQSNIYFHFIL